MTHSKSIVLIIRTNKLDERKKIIFLIFKILKDLKSSGIIATVGVVSREIGQKKIVVLVQKHIYVKNPKTP